MSKRVVPCNGWNLPRSSSHCSTVISISMAKDRRTSKEPNNASPSRRVAPNRSNAAGLDPHVERQLILDINAAGGIKQRLTGLVSSRPDIYGEDYSDHQTKVRSRIKYLKDNPRIYSDCLVFQRLVSSTSKAELPSVSPTPKKSNATALSDSKINAITTKITTMTIDGKSIVPA